jgi:hypothetical protein
MTGLGPQLLTDTDYLTVFAGFKSSRASPGVFRRLNPRGQLLMVRVASSHDTAC